MASSASLKELSKAITTFVAQPSLPLPDELIFTIEAYIDKYEKYDDAAGDRLQEELIAIFEKHVRGKPEATGPWMSILRRLQWALQSPEKVLFWFDACQKILDNTPLEKDVVKETISAMMNTIAVAEKCQGSYEGEATPNPIIDRLFAIWTDKFYPALVEGNRAVEYNEQMLRDAIGHFGKKRPKEFLASLDKYFVKQKHRKAVLRFFCDYVQNQPPHLHQVAETSFFDHLLTCLQRDTSTTVVSAALTTLIMLLPHMPSSLVPHLPTLFNIYARLLFWDRERIGAIELANQDSEQDGDWQTCTYDAATEELFIGHLSPYYTILYGLYPINFMDYIRKPQRYLRHANIANADDIEVQPTEIRHQSERFRRNHLLHPNFYTLTIDSEKTDFQRWIKCEAAEVVADCIGLCISLSEVEQFAQQPHAPPSVHHEEAGLEPTDSAIPDPMLLSTSVTKVHNWRHAQYSSADSAASDHGPHPPPNFMRRASQSSQPSMRDGIDTRFKPGADSPAAAAGAQLIQSPSNSQLQDLIKSNKAIKSGLHQSLANESVASLPLSNQESMADRSGIPHSSMPPPPVPLSAGSVPPIGDVQVQLSALQRRVLLLENDLSFERYLKQQHIAHIGELRSRQVTEAATEAETQNLIMMNRNLKSRYEDAKKVEVQVRKEAEKSRSMAKKWEADLSTKLKNLRDESKKTHAEFEEVHKELQNSKLECDKLRKLLNNAEVKELTWKQNVQSVEIQGEEVERLRGEVTRLTQSERDNQATELEKEAAIISTTEQDTKLLELNMQLVAQQNEVQRTKKLFQSQIRALQEQLSEAQEEHARPGGTPNLAVENALAASRAKQAELQKQYELLLRKYKVVQSSLLDMRSTAPLPPTPQESFRMKGQDSDRSTTAGSPVLMKGRVQRIDSMDSALRNATPPLDPKTGAGLVPVSYQPSSSQGTDSANNPQAIASPPSRGTDQKYFSGLANRIRKDSSERSRDDAGSTSGKSKKEKKSSGLRGIRGFVSS